MKDLLFAWMLYLGEKVKVSECEFQRDGLLHFDRDLLLLWLLYGRIASYGHCSLADVTLY